MPVGIQRLNARKSQPNAHIIFIKPLPGSTQKTAQSFLERIAAQCCKFPPPPTYLRFPLTRLPPQCPS